MRAQETVQGAADAGNSGTGLTSTANDAAASRSLQAQLVIRGRVQGGGQRRQCGILDVSRAE